MGKEIFARDHSVHRIGLLAGRNTNKCQSKTYQLKAVEGGVVLMAFS